MGIYLPLFFHKYSRFTVFKYFFILRNILNMEKWHVTVLFTNNSTKRLLFRSTRLKTVGGDVITLRDRFIEEKYAFLQGVNGKLEMGYVV